MALGAFVGFSIGMAFGVAQTSAWPSTIWRSSAAALGAALLMRWWGRVWASSLQDAHRERHTASRNAARTDRKPKV